MDDVDDIDKVYCHQCNTEQDPGFKFCGNCGAKNLNLFKASIASDQAYNENIRMLATYSALIVVALIIDHVIDTSLASIITITLAFAALDIAFAFAQPNVWKLVFTKIDFKPILWIIPTFIVSGIAVGFFTDNLNAFLFPDEYWLGYTFYFESTSYPLLYSLIIIAVFPAIFEELAFRGFLFDNLKTISGVKPAIWGSAFLFALMHFSILSLLWIFPFGLFLGYLRERHKTLVYGIVAHFTHNATVTIIEYYYGSLAF